MTRLRHPLWALVLALALIATGQAIAAARAMPGATDRITICTGTGPVMIDVGPDGQPVKPRYCPDGAIGLFHTLTVIPVEPRAPLAGPVLRAVPHHRQAPSRPVRTARARAPPPAIRH